MCVLAAEVAPAIVSQLTTSATTLQTLIFQHLLHSSATLNQRAAVLKLLHMSLAPHLDFASLIAKPLANGMSNSSGVHANAADLAETAPTQNEAGVQGSVESKADEQHDPSVAGQAQLDSDSQQLRIKLFTMVLEALPSVIKTAACRSSNSSQQASEAPANAAQTDAQQALSDEDQAEEEQQDAGAEVIDGNAMHALLSLMLRVATDNGSQGMLAVLAAPTALAPILPELLASPQVSCSLAASASCLQVCQIMAHYLLMRANANVDRGGVLH